jgi:hypothetical protein
MQARRSSLARLIRLAAGTLIAATLLAASPSQAYMWEIATAVAVSVSNLRVTELIYPNSMRVEWDYTPLGPSTPQYRVRRRPTGGSWTTLASNLTVRYYVDTTFSLGTSYEYEVLVTDQGNVLGLPPPPE